MKIIAIVLALIFSVLVARPGLSVEPEPGAVWDTWARADLPVRDGLASRTWIWGPDALTGTMVERYDGSPGGTRMVQYFDKSRMEVSDPAADQDSPWFVTNGLLVVEMVTGDLQLGDATFESRKPTGINVAGDGDDPDGPTYETFARLLDTPPLPFDRPIIQTVDRTGNIGADESLASENIQISSIDQVTGHTIAEPFWEFMNSSGTVYEAGEFITGPIFENPYFASGRPITEPYWARVKVAGTVKWVLIQAFERRVLTYTPDNPEGWRVEAGNVGRHYLDWRYGEESGQTVTLDVSGLEVDVGETDGDTTYGLRFIGAASGDLEGTMEVTLDYTPPNPGPGVVNKIVGGDWTLTSPGGSLAGTVQGGSATWDDEVAGAAVVASFVIGESSGDYAGYAGQGTFSGTLSHRVFPPRISGTLTFELVRVTAGTAAIPGVTACTPPTVRYSTA